MNQVLVGVAVAALATPVLLFYAGFGDAVSHRGDMIVTFFPYAAAMRSRSETVELLLTYLQFPLYAFLLTVVRPKHWKILVLVLIILVHIAAVAGQR